GFAIANSLAALQSGATYIDGTLRGLGAGAGNAQTEVLAAVLERCGYDSGLDFFGLMDHAETAVDPMLLRPQVIDNGSLMLGYAGVYSSFLLHVYDAAERYNLEPRDILVELGRRKMVGGQEDMIVDVAYQLTRS
ncbi:MAG: 4-hydroxy-2-oxovalerate aldolase, partial [Oscillospiraceae bacterium]|nr:4-hydroxy-2-oxovalerate aldolase [Oscillospiraceae bacterium]